MKMKKTNKKLFTLLLAFIMLLASSLNTFAADTVQTEEEPYFIINDEIIVPYGEDYENPETGEYFRWTTNENARGSIAKEFEFMVRYSVTSSSFTVSSTKVSVSSSAYVGYSDYSPASGNYNEHAYRVEVVGILTRTLDFEVGGTESGQSLV